MKIIKTSQHKIEQLNTGKQERLNAFLLEYSRAVRFYVNYLWNNKIEYSTKVFDLQRDMLDCPSFISTKNISFTTSLSARALSCASTQACGIVRGVIDERKKLLYKLSKQKEENRKTRKTQRQLLQIKIIKPNLNNIYPELNSICCKFELSNKLSTDGVITLSSLGKTFGQIVIPINLNKHSDKLENNGFTAMTSFLVSKNKIFFRWQKETPKLKEDGEVVGADQGINTVLTLSDKQTTPIDPHGHSLNSILKKISRKKKGSKGFHQAIAHRDNYINWSLNQLNFTDIKQVNLEKLSNFRQEKKVGAFLNYFGETLIREKLLDILAQSGVRIVEQNSMYRSQRCSECGYVCKSNRNGKLFCCKRCSFQADADWNASLNHKQDLPNVKIFLQHYGKQREFFWKAKGFFAVDGSELAVPNTKSNK